MTARARYVASVDQGTSSSRCAIFDREARIVSYAQREHDSLSPRPGWVEHDAAVIWRNVSSVIQEALDNAQIKRGELAGLGLTNQRETTVLWDRDTGEPLGNAITWQDTRTDHLVREIGGADGPERFRRRCGLPLATYFSGPKIRWRLDQDPDLRRRAEAGDVLFGTIDSWLLWNFTGRHLTDVTNAGRTMLMNLESLQWDDVLLDAMGVPGRCCRRSALDGDLRGGHRPGRRRARRRGARRPARGAGRAGVLRSRGRRSAPMGPGSFCCSTRARARRGRRTGCSPRGLRRSRTSATTYALEGSIAVTAPRAVVPRQAGR